MLANFLGKSKPANILVILAFALCFYILGIFTETISFNPWVFLYVPILFGLTNFINVKNKLTFDNLYLFFLFVTLMFLFPKTFVINTTFFANLTLLASIRRVYSLQSSVTFFKKLFDAGFWLGISFIIEPFTAIFTLFLYASVYLHKTVTYRAIIIPIIGFFTPVFLYFTYCLWHEKTTAFYNLFNWFTNYNFTLYKNTNYLFSILFTTFFTIVSIVLKSPKVFSVKNTFQSNWKLVIFNFILSVILIVLTKNKNGTEFLYALFPASVIIANGIEIYQKKRISDIIILLFFVSAVIVVHFL